MKRIFYHGTRWNLPFKEFDPRQVGKGICSSGQKFGGFFFTSEKENAEFFTEWLVCKVEIETEGIDLREDVYDGCMYSDVAFVRFDQMPKVKILEWIPYDIEYLFESYDEMLDGWEFTSLCRAVGLNADYIKSIPFIKQYLKNANTQ